MKVLNCGLVVGPYIHVFMYVYAYFILGSLMLKYIYWDIYIWKHLAFNLESSISFHAIISLLGWVEMKFSAGTLTTNA